MGRHSMCVDGDGRQKLCGLTLMPYDSDHLTAAAPLSSLQNTCIQRCCLLLIMSVGADLSSGDLLWKFKLHFGAIFFFFEWLLRMLKAISNENVKQISVLQSSSGGHQPWLKMILFFFWFGFSASSNLTEFLLQLRSSCYLKKISFVSATSACNAVMEFLWLFCAAPVSALCWQWLWVGCFG